MGSQQFCLKWNNHQSNLIDVFDELLENEAFVDVTLACEGQSLKAHKVVLSACSPFFKSLLRENPCKHPIIIMKDMKYLELRAILQFMYKGEVSVSQELLNGLLRTAEALKVKGLAEVQRTQQKSAESIGRNSESMSYETNNDIQPSESSPASPVMFNKKRRKRFNDEVHHIEPKSKLESSLLGLHRTSSSNVNQAKSLDGDVSQYSSSVDRTDESSSSILKNHNNNLLLTHTPIIKNVISASDHNSINLHLDNNNHLPAQNTDQSAQDIDDDIEIEEIDEKPDVTYIPTTVDDMALRTNNNNDDANLTDNSLSNLDLDNTPDVSAVAIASQGFCDSSGNNKGDVRRQCHICKKVLRSAQINRHIRAIHLNARFQCHFCPATYNDRSNLKRHMKAAHFGLGGQTGLDANFDNNNSIISGNSNHSSPEPEDAVIKVEPDAFPDALPDALPDA